MIAFCLAVGYFPASGRRSIGAEFLVFIGTAVFCWTSSSSGREVVQSAYLWCESGLTFPLGIDGSRNYARPVRCVQAFIK